jgi:hypothetical protein
MMRGLKQDLSVDDLHVAIGHAEFSDFPDDEGTEDRCACCRELRASG